MTSCFLIFKVILMLTSLTTSHFKNSNTLEISTGNIVSTSACLLFFKYHKMASGCKLNSEYSTVIFLLLLRLLTKAAIMAM